MILVGDCIEGMRLMPAGAARCCVTSPPYFGLRSYMPDGVRLKPGLSTETRNAVIAELQQLGIYPLTHTSDNTYRKSEIPQHLLEHFESAEHGLEPTPAEYIAQMVAVFREVRRVLTDDGVLFLNLGDSYFGSGKGGGGSFSPERPGWREVPCGTFGKAPEDSQASDCLCGNLCDVCREVRRRTSHTDPVLLSMLRASLRGSIRAHTGVENDHPPTSDSAVQVIHNEAATPGPFGIPARASEPLRASVESMLGEFSPQLLDECLRRASHGECLLCARSLGGCVLECGDKTACTCGTSSRSGASRLGMTGKSSLGLAYLDSTITSLKPKDLIGIPWMLAFALRADGWYLRQDIIWSKPNPMPESVRDRCTKAHEYVFLLSKAPRYYFDAEGIAEQATSSYDPNNAKQPDGWASHEGGHGSFHRDGREPGRSGNKARKAASERGVPVDDGGKASGAVAGSVPWEGVTRNRRSVWPIATQPFKGAHFATMPETLARLCILAGSAPGDTVLDPYTGAGTTWVAAQALGRRFIGAELNPDYATMAERRVSNHQPGLALGVA